MSPDIRWVRQDTHFATQVQDETVVISLETNCYYGFGRVGSRIWELLAQPIDFGSLCARLQQEYKVDEATCKEDTIPFLQQLWQERLIVRVE
jgi:hypothetical protein